MMEEVAHIVYASVMSRECTAVGEGLVMGSNE